MIKISTAILGQFIGLISATVFPSSKQNKPARRLLPLMLALILPAMFVSNAAQAEPVIWTNLVGAAVSGSNLLSGGNNGWIHGASSQQSMAGDGARIHGDLDTHLHGRWSVQQRS